MLKSGVGGKKNSLLFPNLFMKNAVLKVLVTAFLTTLHSNVHL